MKRILSLILLSLATLSLDAKVTLPTIFSDNMVLQQKADVAFWGKATGKRVTITASWVKGKTVVTPDADGKWFVRIPTPSAGGPFELTFNDGEKTALHNVLVGEVWFCSGQSNMVMSMRGFIGQPVENAAEYILSAREEIPIRLCDIPNRQSSVPLPSDSLKTEWKLNTPDVVLRYSATAYFFARSLQEQLRVPVGVITADWGGVTIETWMSKEVIDREFPGEFDHVVPEVAYPKTPAVLYNAMVAPIVPFTFKGIIWYQGEENRLRPEQYSRLQPAYVRMMRELFQNPDAPFYFVQIAPYAYDGNPSLFTSGYFFEAQQKTLSTIPHSGMVATLDLGSYSSIHPPKKLEVGRRLASLALYNDYGYKVLNPNAPSYKSVAFEGPEAVITVENVEWMGLFPGDVAVGVFEVAGADRVFHPAEAVAHKYTITVRSEEVPTPVAVRYGFRNYCEATLFSAWGIPLLPFRTDNWDDLTE